LLVILLTKTDKRWLKQYLPPSTSGGSKYVKSFLPYRVEDAEYFAGACAERPSSGERVVRLERETGDEQVVSDGEVQHEAHGSRPLGGARQRHDRQRVADRPDDERD